MPRSSCSESMSDSVSGSVSGSAYDSESESESKSTSGFERVFEVKERVIAELGSAAQPRIVDETACVTACETAFGMGAAAGETFLLTILTAIAILRLREPLI
jgi:hypothetical protein